MTARVMISSQSRGSALVLVLWSTLLMSLAVFAVVEMVELSVDHAGYEQSAIEAQASAASGVALGLVPQMQPDDPLLQQRSTAHHGFSVTIESEGARLNLNYLLLTNHRDVLVSLFTSWGMKMINAQHAAACLYDWVTPGDLPSLDGAKAAAYESAGLPQRPTHQPFQSWNEVEEVLGMDQVAAAHPNWQDAFTIWSEGPLDLNAAPADLMAALFGVEEGRVTALVTTRNGRDGIPGTRDDVPLTAAVIQGQLGLSDLQMTALQNEFMFSSSIRRIKSIGYAGSASARISVVTHLNVTPPQFLVWSER